MKLKKIAHIQIPVERPQWMSTHLANPVATLLNEETLRVYCNVRNEDNRTHIIYLDLDMNNNFEIKHFQKNPLLELGPIGAFDDCGQSLGCIINANNEDYLFYLGWNLASNVPFRNSIGLARRQNGNEHFSKISLGPIMDRNTIDPFCLSYPFVIKDKDKYKMWYGSHTVSGSTIPEIRHSIKYAESDDLVTWDRNDIICLEASDIDKSFTKPFVMVESGVYKMWYSYLRDQYRIGYAESLDGLTWKRMDDQVGIDVSESGWDSDMIEYPYLFDYKGERYMIYCGNQFGKSGFGLAKFV